MAVPAGDLIGDLTRETHRIGPNAIIRIAEALGAMEGQSAAQRVFAGAHLTHHLNRPPTTMVDEQDVIDLHAALHAECGPVGARRIAERAGELTAHYLLAKRIPRPAQFLLNRLPGAYASRALLKAIAKNAWTFCGSGELEIRQGVPVVLSIADCPLCRRLRMETPACSFYAATFETLFRRLVAAEATASEVACQAMGGPACVFEITW